VNLTNFFGELKRRNVYNASLDAAFADFAHERVQTFKAIVSRG
jgi:hypothetical protein